MGLFKNKTKTEVVTKQSDLELLLSCMEKLKDKDYTAVDTSIFTDAAVGEAYNAMLGAVLDRNNRMTMRLNDAMVRIGDSQPVKNMIDSVEAQTGTIADMRLASQSLDTSIAAISKAAGNIKGSSGEILSLSNECTEKMNESFGLIDTSNASIRNISVEMQEFKNKAQMINDIIDRVGELAEESSLLGLNASIEAARAGEAGKGFAIVAEQVNQLSQNTTTCAEDVVRYVGELMTGIDQLMESITVTSKSLDDGNRSVKSSIELIKDMNAKIGGINADIADIGEEISNQSTLTREFVSDIGIVSDGYDDLQQKCLDIGSRFYRMSRDIDCARSDNFRDNSCVTELDRILVFEMDHQIFTWRVYNHIAGYERLKITQLNNPGTCKIGKWFAGQTNPQITGSEGFVKAFDAHNCLHEHAVNAWNYCEENNKGAALNEFEQCLTAFEEMREGLHMLADTLRSIGLTDETPIWKFQ